jgi:1-acyl-sn-glycerol-3-phosphate acyltransferase
VSSVIAQRPPFRGAAARGVSIARAVVATLVIYFLGYPLTAVGVVLGCCAALVGWRSFIRVGTVVWAHMLFVLNGRVVHVRGRENLVPGTPCLIVANHASMFDIPALMAAVPGIAIMGRDYLLRIPVFGILLRILHYVPIDTSSGRSARSALDQAARTVQEGITLGIFPEGTRTETGRVQSLKRGFVHILRSSGAPLVPVHISGTFALKPKGTFVLNPRERIEVTIGLPVPGSMLEKLTDEQIMAKAKVMIE